MTYLFDTDHISFLQRRSGPEYAVLTLRIAAHKPDDFAFSVINLHEQTMGANNFIARAKNVVDSVRGYTMFLDILRSYSAVAVLPFDAAAAAVFDHLQAARIRVATMDLRLAAIALSRNLVLLSRNTRDFGRVPGLRFDDWTV